MAETFRIVSDGTPGGTRVYDPEGRPMGMVRRVSVSILANDAPTAEIETVLPKIDIRANGERIVCCPHCLNPIGRKVDAKEAPDG
jgi:hypothetical protein